MRINEQVFCKCGKGRSFMQCSATKAEAAQWKQEWLADLERDGWQGINLSAMKAEKCNICNKEKVHA